MARTIVFIHGAWVTPACWEPLVGWFEARGYRCLAPAWPGKDRPIEEIRRDPSPLVGLGVAEIVDHYEKIVRGLDAPPILVGHSFGGLFTQILLDRGLGAAGVTIDSAPPKGVFAYQPTSFRSPAVCARWARSRVGPIPDHAPTAMAGAGLGRLTRPSGSASRRR